LSGSEYHTYSLPKRVGKQRANELLEACLPIGAKKAQEIGMVDKLFAHASYKDELKSFCKELLTDEDAYEDFLWDKEDFLEENREMIEAKREAEIAVMHPEFWDEESEFHRLRYEFVYKICPRETPKRLKANARDL
jgi:putative two-component system hydrogenase maturation factor HypX/HoxX